MEGDSHKKRAQRWVGWLTLTLGLLLLATVLLLLRLSVVTDYFYHALIKDPPRQIPPGNNIVAPADGIVLYIKKIEDGVIPEIVKKGVAIPLREFIKNDLAGPMKRGYLIGIYMNVESVHITRVPVDGTYTRQIVFNGPHMSMSKQETAVILTAMIPGLVTIKKLLGLDPFSIEKYGDYILKSARETSVFKDVRGTFIYVIRIADFWVGNILTWIEEGQDVKKGQKMGMITWGSQVDICFEHTPGLKLHDIKVGDYIYAGKTILASY
ncbi:MAG: phosphatidylserine decarboxylase [Planctomycetota bacterium]|nr:MAG: phosphatidylserine decarboxylase [Planctomycetota bacterium]